MVNVTRTRPQVPAGYGLSTDESTLLDWSWVETRLIAARNYWVASVYPDGRPHVSPVWGAWLPSDQRLVFG